MRGDVDVLHRQQSRDSRYDLICKRLQRRLHEEDGANGRASSHTGNEGGRSVVEVWLVRPKAFESSCFERGGDDYAASLNTLRSALLHHRVDGRHAFHVAEVPDGVLVAPKRTLACRLQQLVDAIPSNLAPAAPSTHCVPLFHMRDGAGSPFPVFDAPDGGTCLGVRVMCFQGHVALYVLSDATAWPLASPRFVGMDTKCYHDLQDAAARMLRLVATPCLRGGVSTVV